MKRLLSFIACAVLVVLAACKPKEAMETAQPNPDEATTATTEKEVAGVAETPTDLSPMEAQARIDDVTIGHALGADGAIATDQTGDDFAPGQPVYIAMEVGDTPAGSAVKAQGPASAVDWRCNSSTRRSAASMSVMPERRPIMCERLKRARASHGSGDVGVMRANPREPSAQTGTPMLRCASA